MKKGILILAVLMTSIVAQAQSLEKSSPTKSQTEYSFVWGLFKSKDYPKGQSFVFEFEKYEFEKPEFSTTMSEPAVDGTQYEQKSILWGAIQWTEKKNNTSPVKSQSNGK